MINMTKLGAPYLHFTQIRKHAESLRKECCQEDIYPLDVFSVAEFCLGLAFQPESGLKDEFDIDAIMLADFKTILIDNNEFVDKVSESRLRFSIAHEIGHLILHRKHLLRLNVLPKKTQGVYNFLSLISDKEYHKYEYQANEFAGRFLVPVDDLVKKIDGYCSLLNITDSFYLVDDPEFLDAMFANVAKKFGVSSEVIMRRVKYEQLNLNNIIWNSLNGIRAI